MDVAVATSCASAASWKPGSRSTFGYSSRDRIVDAFGPVEVLRSLPISILTVFMIGCSPPNSVSMSSQYFVGVLRLVVEQQRARRVRREHAEALEGEPVPVLRGRGDVGTGDGHDDRIGPAAAAGARGIATATVPDDGRRQCGSDAGPTTSAPWSSFVFERGLLALRTCASSVRRTNCIAQTRTYSHRLHFADERMPRLREADPNRYRSIELIRHAHRRSIADVDAARRRRRFGLSRRERILDELRRIGSVRVARPRAGARRRGTHDPPRHRAPRRPGLLTRVHGGATLRSRLDTTVPRGVDGSRPPSASASAWSCRRSATTGRTSSSAPAPPPPSSASSSSSAARATRSTTSAGRSASLVESGSLHGLIVAPETLGPRRAGAPALARGAARSPSCSPNGARRPPSR